MTIYIYFSLAILFFLIPIILVKARMVYLNAHPEKYISSYDGHEIFLDMLLLNLRKLSLKVVRLTKNLRRLWLHLWVRLTAKFKTYTEKVYMRNRNKFMEEVVKDKKAVPYFWDHLKKYKKEIDEEKGSID